MQALTLEYVQNTKPKVLPLMILVIAILFAGYLSKAYFDLMQEKDRWQTKWSHLQHEQKRMQGGNLNGAESARLKPELTRVNEVVRQLTLPWDGLFKAIEAASFEDVALLSINPDISKQSVTLIAEAKDLISMLEYAKRLSEEPMLVDAQITSHQIQQQDPQKPIRFVITAFWKPK